MTVQTNISLWEQRLCTLWGMANCSHDPVVGFSILSQELYGAFTFEEDKEKSEDLNFLIYISDNIISSYSNNKGCPKTPFRDVKHHPGRSSAPQPVPLP